LLDGVDELQEGELLVAEGDHNGEHWRFAAGGTESYQSLRLLRPHGVESVQFGTDPFEAMELSSRIGGDRPVIGVVDPQADELVVDAAGTAQSVPLDETTIAGRPVKVFVFFVSDDTPGSTEIVARERVSHIEIAHTILSELDD
jgi:hypothetical protein